MNLYELRKKLEESGRAVFSTIDIARVLSSSKAMASVYTHRLVRKGLLFNVEKGKVSLTKDPFIAASQLLFPAYISLVSALYLYGVVSQVIDMLYLITTRKRNAIVVFGTDVVFIKTDPKMMFGYKKIEKGASFIMLAELEKAVIDCLYFPRYCRLSYVLDAIKKANVKKLEEHALRLDKEPVTRRLGYMLDLLGRKHSLIRKTNTAYKLNPSIKRKGRFDPKWYLYVNEELKC